MTSTTEDGLIICKGSHPISSLKVVSTFTVRTTDSLSFRVDAAEVSAISTRPNLFCFFLPPEILHFSDPLLPVLLCFINALQVSPGRAVLPYEMGRSFQVNQ